MSASSVSTRSWRDLEATGGGGRIGGGGAMTLTLAETAAAPTAVIVTSVAFVVDHLSVTAWPASITGGSTVIEAVGPGGVGRGASCKGGGGAGGANATFLLQPVVSPIKDIPRRSTVISHLTLMIISLCREPSTLAATVTTCPRQRGFERLAFGCGATSTVQIRKRQPQHLKVRKVKRP